MSWNMDVQYVNPSYPYNIAGGFMEYFEGLTYDHVNFIFSGASQAQESIYPSMSTNLYKFGLSEPGSYSFYDQCHAYEMNSHGQTYYEGRRPMVSSPMGSTPTAAVNSEWVGATNVSPHDSSAECLRRHQNSQDYQVIWQDNVDPDSMTYEELLELGETVGTQSRGLPQEIISLLPVSKYKRGFFSRKKSRDERCVICQMEYRRGDKRMTLPCRHIYHAGCASKWLNINKACPICYTEVSLDVPETVKNNH